MTEREEITFDAIETMSSAADAIREVIDSAELTSEHEGILRVCRLTLQDAAEKLDEVTPAPDKDENSTKVTSGKADDTTKITDVIDKLEDTAFEIKNLSEILLATWEQIDSNSWRQAGDRIYTIGKALDRLANETDDASRKMEHELITGRPARKEA